MPAYLLGCAPKKDAHFACQLLSHSTYAVLPQHSLCWERSDGESQVTE